MLIKMGSAGTVVAKLCADLKHLGYFSGAATDIFNRDVWEAVRAFQMQNVDSLGRPLVVDGIVGPVTAWAVASRLANAPTPTSVSTTALSAPSGGSATGQAALQVAINEMKAGNGEVGGNNMGPHVTKYLNGKATPPANWCAGFVSYCFQNSGHPMPFTYSVGARDILTQMKSKGWLIKPDDTHPPQPGDIIVWWRNTPSSWEGHIGIVHSYNNGIVRTIEGNKTSKV
ncbi:CHAP domain-containing protein, partial [Devosia sp.]|uniref:CHAP domain-containing protein n=1 Tax=Devosia sp. TaxID=1871048 RepID=UPI001AD2FEFF